MVQGDLPPEGRREHVVPSVIDTDALGQGRGFQVQGHLNAKLGQVNSKVSRDGMAKQKEQTHQCIIFQYVTEKKAGINKGEDQQPKHPPGKEFHRVIALLLQVIDEYGKSIPEQ